MSSYEPIEFFFDDFSEKEKKNFNPNTIKWLATLIKSGSTVKPVARSTASSKWNLVKEKWIKVFKNESSLPGVRIQAIFRSIQNYSGPSDEILHASELLNLSPGEATEELLRIIDDKNLPRIYQNLEDYHTNLARVIENKMSITIIDAFLLEITSGVIKYLSDSSQKNQILEAVHNRVRQITLLLEGLTSNKPSDKPLKKIILISVLTHPQKLKKKISGLTVDDEELKAKLENAEVIKEATEKVSDMILTEVGKQVPAVCELGLKVEIKNLKSAIDNKELISPHDRMIISNNAPEWCATAGFALDLRKNEVITPQGYFVKFWRSDANQIQTESLPVTHIQYGK